MSGAEKARQESKGRGQKFKGAWLTTLLKNMEGQLEPAARLRLMEACGRDCARRASVKMAEPCRGDVGKLVKSLARILGAENCTMDKNVVNLSYGKCYCELVTDGPERLSETYCLCSKGWILEMFETAAGRPVRVDVLQTIKRGAPSCRFLVRL
jgi:predicted hydrocarbon binding protein